MQSWNPQQYLKFGLDNHEDKSVIDNAILTAEKIVNVHPALPPVFTLRHLAHLSDTDYGLLRKLVKRELKDPYKVFNLQKKSKQRGFRVICVPDPQLMRVQKWIASNILQCGQPHSASCA